MAEVQAEHPIGERRTLRILDWPRSTHPHRSVREDPVALRMRLRELALARPRYGYRRLTVLLKREGWMVNHKRVHRLLRLEGLMVRPRKKRKLACRVRLIPPEPSSVNERWAIDFVSDALHDGRRFRALTVIDIFSRECLAIEVSRSLPATRVTEVPDRVVALRGRPRAITLDNGTEFTSRHFDAWAYGQEIRLDFIQIGLDLVALPIGFLEVLHAILDHKKSGFLHELFHGFGHGLADLVDFPERCFQFTLKHLHARFQFFLFLFRQRLKCLLRHGFSVLDGDGLVT